MTGQDVTREAELLRDLLKMASGNGLAHESVNIDNLEAITRPEFGWANAMTVRAIAFYPLLLTSYACYKRINM